MESLRALELRIAIALPLAFETERLKNTLPWESRALRPGEGWFYHDPSRTLRPTLPQAGG